MSKKYCPNCPERLGTVGGQAVLEGVMMKSKDIVALSVRKPDGSIETETTRTVLHVKNINFSVFRSFAA